VRDHDGLARIEIAPDELGEALDMEFVRATRAHMEDLGFEHVTLDLHGYRTGSVSPGSDSEDDGGSEGKSGEPENAAGLLDAEYPTAE
jgi:hypothetical protein